MSDKSLHEKGFMAEEVVHFVKELTFDDLPSEVIQTAKTVILDTLGAMLAASLPKYSAGKILTEIVRELGGAEESTIIGQNFRSSCVNAVLVNGTLGYYCDIEAHHPEAVVHPAATIVPTSLAVGEKQRCDGKTLLLSFILGTELDCRVSSALNPRVLYDRGFHPSCIAGAIGASVAAGRILNLDAKKFQIAMGLAAQQTSGLLAWKEDFSENSRPFNHSIAARNGVTAALLAAHDFGGPSDIFQGIYNIFRAFSVSEYSDPKRITEELGKKFAVVDLAFKRYSCCAFLHPGLDALFTIMDEEKLGSKDIESIVLRFAKNGTELIDGTELRSHSAQYIFPIAAVNRKVMIDDILFDRRSEPEIERLMGLTKVVGDEELDAGYPKRYSSIVEVTTRGGRNYSARVDHAAGTPQNPFSYEEIKQKFFDLSKFAVDRKQAEMIVNLVEKIEELNDVNVLGSLLGKEQ